MDFSKIKLIVWDLDDTFWKGTLSEGPVEPLNESINVVSESTDCGVVNAICSKNTFVDAEETLKKMGVWDSFVFKSIDWSPKGERLAAFIKDLGLRPVNVFF